MLRGNGRREVRAQGEAVLAHSMSFGLSCFLKPKRKDAFYMRFLWIHFFSFAFVSEVSASIGWFRLNNNAAWINLVRLLLVWPYVFKQKRRVREAASGLTDVELSHFLCTSILKKGTACLVPMVFFSFETIACFIEEGTFLGEENNRQCEVRTCEEACVLDVDVLLTISPHHSLVAEFEQRFPVPLRLLAGAGAHGYLLQRHAKGGAAGCEYRYFRSR